MNRVLGDDTAEVLALCNELSPWMNGPSASRLAQALIGRESTDLEWLARARERISPAEVARWRDEIERLRTAGVEVIAATDPAYPTNLAMVHDGPPALFVRGALDPADRRSVAIVGTRAAGDEGKQFAHELAKAIASMGVTIVSGLAKGIDTAAHAGALNAGGRTIAVYGTTIERVYPASNRSLAEHITATGACVSQFLPTRQTGRWAFPARNVTMSGLSLATIVVEASETSGAKLQAEAALAHGKRVFLVENLVRQKWAEEMAHDPNVAVTSDPAAIIEAIDQLVVPLDHVLL